MSLVFLGDIDQFAIILEQEQPKNGEKELARKVKGKAKVRKKEYN